jgi:hypothetical protein
MDRIANLYYRNPRLIIIVLILVCVNGFFLFREISTFSRFDDRNIRRLTVEQALKEIDHEQQVVLTDALVDCSRFVYTPKRTDSLQASVAITDPQGKNLIIGVYNAVLSCESIAHKPVTGKLQKLPSFYFVEPLKSRIIQNRTISPDNLPGIYNSENRGNSLGLIIIESIGFLTGLWIFFEMYKISRIHRKHK